MTFVAGSAQGLRPRPGDQFRLKPGEPTNRTTSLPLGNNCSIGTPSTRASMNNSQSATQRSWASTFATDTRLTSHPARCSFAARSSCVMSWAFRIRLTCGPTRLRTCFMFRVRNLTVMTCRAGIVPDQERDAVGTPVAKILNPTLQMNPKSSHPSSRLLTLIAVPAILWLTAFADAADVQEGDQIKLIRNESLLFRDQVFRTAQEGELFTVLAYRPAEKRIFVGATDKEGKEIALSIPEDAIVAVQLDSSELQAQAVAAVKAGRISDSLRLIARGLRSDPTDPALQQTAKAIARLQTAAEAINRTVEAQKPVAVEAARLRKNAAVIDHPNPLDGNTSGRARAGQMRATADQSETTARVAVENSKKAYEIALQTVLGMEGVNQKLAGETAGYLNDPAVIPAQFLDGKVPSPGYKETIEFINSKVSVGGQKLWFGKKTQKMILSSMHARELLVFDPAEANPGVKYTANPPRRDQFEANNWVTISTSSGRSTFRAIRGDFSKPIVEEEKSFRLDCDDAIDAEKVAKAMRHLLIRQ